jgi:SAM-dependent methyltransferase
MEIPLNRSTGGSHLASLAGVYGRRPSRLKLTASIIEITTIEPGCELLEIGCGEGSTAAYLAEYCGCKVVGVDLESGMLSVARQQAASEGSPHGLVLCSCDACNLPFCAQRFDYIWCESTFSTLADKPRAIREFRRILRPGGKLILLDFVLGRRVNPEVQKSMSFLPCLGRTKTVQDFVTLFESLGFEAALSLDYSDEVKRSGFWLGAMYGSLGELFSKMAAGCCPVPLRNNPANVSLNTFKQFLSEAQLGYALLVFSRLD